ncbi:MAG TPA: ATP-binding cassette domain-containing protein [Chthoniobacteraceae bacterium]|jgi:ABC-type multidrug transport system ATPase subunit|nr:ATP-binding cassette domain-containing protein [Chthoniobacteraceae bacterium]
MSILHNGFTQHIREHWQHHPMAHRLRRLADVSLRRVLRKPRTVTESPNLLPLLIQVLAAFSKTGGGEVLEEEIDSSLGFLRYDYPEAVYSELRKLFRQALNEQQDLTAMSQKLAVELSAERKIMLGVQLYDLISKAGMDQKQVVAYYGFMAQLGMAAQAIDIVYQLNAADESDKSVYQHGQSPLESLTFGGNGAADVTLKGLEGSERLVAFRYHDLILLKNQSSRGIVVRGRPLGPGAFCRVYSGQRIVLGEQVLTYQDLAYYFNAKKNVSLTQVYLAIDNNDEVQLDKVRNRESSLEVTFGLKVQVRALREVDALLNGIALRAGVTVVATLDDKIVFHNDSELPLGDLRRRARALGARFQLKAYKSGYLVSNNPSLLDTDDILLSPGTSGEVLLKILCDYENKVGRLEVLQADRPILVGDEAVRGTVDLKDGDTIRIDTGQVLRCNFTERIIEEERNIISSLELRDVTHKFRRDQTGLDGINFSVRRGEMVCVMGASGSGKSTLLRCIAGQQLPTEGEVLLNGQSLYRNLPALKAFVAYIPQDDAFDDHLTIEENMQFAAAIRSPHLSGRDRARRIEGRLIELGLIERRGSVVGSPVKKRLSGGERKRLNIGLDMISGADVFLFDEPTSGLSSKDSEHVIEIIRSMAHNKIVLVTIHQPNSKLFQMFSKALLLDKGGRLVFYGTPAEMLNYFAKAEHEQHFGTELGGCPACGTTRPEFIFDVLETPLRDLSGDVIYEENTQGQLVPARRFSPDYWRDKYESFRLLQDVKQVNLRKSAATSTEPLDRGALTLRKRQAIRWRDEWTQFRTLWRRAFISKLRNRGSLILTLLVPPVLAALIGWALYFTDDESGQYTFASAFHIPTYIFIALLLALFLALVNSVDDIIRDRVVLHRERNLDVRLGSYIAAKFGTLILFSAVQCALFTLVGNAILEISGMFWPYFFFMLITAASGTSLGLLISSLVADSKTAVICVPAVLIPQLIFGGALIKYEDMNKDLDAIYSIKRWIFTHPEAAVRPREDEKLTIPLISRLVATHYTYEALIVAQAKLNPLAARQDAILKQIETLVAKAEHTPAEEDRLEDLKETLALLSGMDSGSDWEIAKRLKRVDKIISGGELDTGGLRSRTRGVTAERLFTNQKVNDLVAKAETEQSDYRRAHKVNVFFGPQKTFYLGPRDWEWVSKHPVVLSVFTVNALVIIGSSLGLLVVLYAILQRQLRTRGI